MSADSLTVLQQSCSCAACQEACKRTPGWFAPGEAEEAAKLLGIPFAKFVSEYLVIDYWIAEDDGGDVYVYTPGKVAVEVESRGKTVSWGYAFNRGTCVFYGDDGLCKIHAAKPTECRLSVPHRGEGWCPPEGRRDHIQGLWKAQGNPLAAVAHGEPCTDAECEDLHLNEREERRIEASEAGFITLRSLRDLALVALLTLCAWASIVVLCGMSEVAR